LSIEILAKMPPAARGSFEKPPLDPTKLFINEKKETGECQHPLKHN
jgi:hypothetical protein